MIEILKCLKGLSPTIKNGIFMLKKYAMCLKKFQGSRESVTKDHALQTRKYNLQRTAIRQQLPEKIKKYLPP